AASTPTRFATAARAESAGAEPRPPSLSPDSRLKQVYTLNQHAFIPAQCYTKTRDARGKAHNPCYTCHISARAPNYIDDGDVQLEYAFVPRARVNPWRNLFVDWTSRIARISDEDILAYVRTSNYFGAERRIVLGDRLAKLPLEWDHGSDGKWSGFVPDARFSFDTEGFDRLAEGGYTGWRAFAYYPVPGTFWPTNGSFGDVLIRLPQAFRQDQSGQLSLEVYELNLAIVEAVVTRRSVKIDPTDEARFGVDLNGDGKLGRATRVVFVAAPEARPRMSYVGRARAEQATGHVHLAPGLYPEDTEFLHTVRYLDPTPTGLRMAARLKELRYARKREWWSYARLDKRARVEAITKLDSPSELRNFGGDIERGVDNGQGWTFQGFIEDQAGALRPQSFEETVACIGCHGGIGATDDAIFSFSRRLAPESFQKGWYHWSQHGLEGVKDRRLPDGNSEYVAYLERNGAGDEFRQNTEVIRRFFDDTGRLRADMKARLQRDVSEVLLPSRERALALNKAYRLLVREQSFRLGRDIVLDGARNVHERVNEGEKTGITARIEAALDDAAEALARRE
ncbi:MAG TPA: hypothetical protein VK524_21120, partial [Polyangiaceae bacterium]|nr:hypothetical protein [Polyangiaceae bacterium]